MIPFDEIQSHNLGTYPKPTHSMTLHPLQSNLLCHVHEGKELGRIHLPDDVQIQPYAEIIEAGPDCKWAKVGMKVLFSPQSVIFADSIDGKKTVLVNESAVFAEWKDEAPVPFS